MIIWGTRGETVNLGHAGTQHCTVCERERSFHYLLQYRYFHLYWFLGTITQKEFLMLCDVCNRGWKLNFSEVGKRLGKSLPIPFLRQFGLLTLGAIFAGFVVLAVARIYGLILLLLIGGGVFLWMRQRQKSR